MGELLVAPSAATSLLMAGHLPRAHAYPLLEAQDGWAVNFFFEDMPLQDATGFRFHATLRTPAGFDLLDYLDPHNDLPCSLTRWDDLPANWGDPDYFAPFCTQLFNQ